MDHIEEGPQYENYIKEGPQHSFHVQDPPQHGQRVEEESSGAAEKTDNGFGPGRASPRHPREGRPARRGSWQLWYR